MFFLPETKWDRRGSPVASIEMQAQTSDSSLKDDMMVTKTEQIGGTENIHRPAPYTADPLEERISGRPSKTQMLPVVGWKAHEPVLEAIILPFKLARFPIVLWGAIQFTLSASCYLMINLIQSQALGAPPYNFSPANVGYTNLAFWVGVCISLLTAGPLSDWVSQRATTRNNGVREPEMRLPALLPFAICTIIGSVVLSVGFQHGWPWEVVVIVGFTLIGVQVAAVSGIAITYVVSSTRGFASHITDLTLSGRLLQACGRRISRLCHCVQECVGLWYEQVLERLDSEERLHWSSYDHRCFKSRLYASRRRASVLLWQEVPRVVGQQLSSLCFLIKVEAVVECDAEFVMGLTGVDLIFVLEVVRDLVQQTGYRCNIRCPLSKYG